MQVFILAVAIAAVLGADPRCLDQNEHGFAVHIAHPMDCRKFYKCDEDHNLSEEICPGNLEYNPVLQVCDYPRGFCRFNYRTSIESALNCDVLPNGAFLPDYSDGCKSFFYCVNGIAKISQCRNGTKFDQDRGYCAPESQVECDSSKVLEFETNKPKNEEGHPTILSRSATTDSDESRRYPNFKNGCKSFMECNEGDCVEVYCPEGYIFDMIKETCEERANAFCDDTASHPSIEARGPEPSCVVEHGRWYPDNDNCNMFYVCSGGKAYHQKCHNGQYFDRTKRACLKGNCPSIPGPGGPDDCDSSKDLFLPDDTDCTKFYICINNKKVHQQCGDHQMYDKNAKYCRSDDKGECIPGGNPGSCDGYPSGSHLPNPADCTKFFLCIDGKKISQQCKTGQMFDSVKGYCVKDTAGICVPLEPECDKSCDGEPEGTKKVDPYNCADFKLCVDREWRTQSCDGGKYFNPHTLECVPDDGSCDKVKPTLKPTTPPPELPCGDKPHGTYEPIPDDCTKFRLCLSGSWRYLTCDPGYYFNVDELVCKLDDGTCDKVLPLPSTTPCEPVKCKDGALKPHIDCKKYKMCVKGDWIEQECKKGQMFDPELNHCVKDPFDGTCRPKPTDCDGHPDGSLKENPNDCTGFFVCVTGTWIPQTCNPDQYFNNQLLYCVPDPHDGTCRPKPTPNPTDCDGNPHGTTKEKEGDCTGFLVCVRGTWIPQTCDPDKYFDKNLKYCVPDPHDGTCRPPLQKKCDGIYPHGSQKPNTGDCTGFFVCVLGDWIPQTCGKDKYYNKQLQYCVEDPLDGTCRPKPTPTPPKDCDGHPHGTFKENTRDCTGYFICVIGTWIEQTCGPDKYYNSALQYCVPDPHDGTCRPPTTAPECDKTCDGMPEGTKKIQSDNCAGFLLCVDGSWRAQSCDRGHWFNPSLLVCELDLLNQCDQTLPTLPPTLPPVEESCGTSPHGTFRPDENDCTSFYLCIYGEWRHLSCDPGYYFEPKLLRCVLNHGECDTALPLPTPTPCHTDCDGYSHGSFKPYENDCHKFYVCVQSKWIPQTCSDGFYFDEVNHYCREDKHNVCPGTGTPEDCGTHKEGEYVKHADCKKFYICIKGNLLEYNCGANQYFDETLKYCKAGTCSSKGDCSGLPDGTTIPHEDKNECDKFYVCYRGKKVLNQCDLGQYFDQTSKYCQQDVSGTCHPTSPTKDCTGIPDGTYLPHENPNECNKFYVCFRGKKVLNQCGTGFYYDKGDQTCHAGSCPPSGGGNKCTSQLDGTVLVDSSNCAGFIVCYKQQEKQQTCGANRRYDESKGYCVENLGTCVPGTPIGTSVSKSNCKGKPDGTVFKHAQCNKFYMCKNENLITSDCAESYLFDESLGRCRKNDGSCPQAGIENICINTGDVLLPHYKCTKFFACVNNKAIEKTCPTNNFFDSKKGVCRINNGECKDARSFRTSISATNECTGRPDGVIVPDNDDCSSFYLCIRGKSVKQFCGEDHRFDQNLGMCVHDDSGSCLLTRKTTTYINTTCVDQEDGTYLANFDACNQYYICINNFAIPQECPDSYMFDQTISTCIPNDGRCPLANVMKPVDNDLNNVDCEGKHGVFVPDLTNCEQFFACLYGKPEAFRCSNGQYFDAIKRICRPNNGECAQKSLTTGDKCEGLKEGSIVAHETDCTMFYVCTNGQPKVAICDQGYFFDSIAKECRMDDGTCNGARSRSNAVCYGKHGTLIGHPDCQKYYICLNGQALLSQCLKGYYFDTKAGTCKNDIYGLCEPKNITMFNPPKTVSCIGKTENRFYANIQDNCRSFYSCVKGEPKIANCPSGLLYNAILNTCDWPGFVKCVNNKMPRVEEKTCVGAVDGVRYPNIKTGCKSFINCVNGVAHESYCSDGLLFNSKKNVCDWAQSVTCNGYGYQENTFSAIKLYN